jgi:sialic acid synthase SpsE
MELVQGRWRLLYSTFSLEKDTNLQRLSFGKLPGVRVRISDIFQEIKISGQEYNNLTEVVGSSGIKAIVTVNGCYTIENVKRLNINFIKTSVCAADKSLESTSFRKALEVDDDCVLESPLEFSGWSDITYLDENLRLMRGNANNLYVLLRDD